jgi:manganese/zinc/iron transport system substrate-binding protein
MKLHYHNRHYWLVFSSVLCSIFIYFCVTNHNATSPYRDKRFCVVCTTTMLADAIHAIDGNTQSIRVITLMGPGIDPHLYRAREGDVHRIANANLVLYHGLHLEGKLADLFAGMQAYLPTVAITEILDPAQLRTSTFGGIYDPHVWHDVELWITCVKNVRNALIIHNPQYAQQYEQNATAYIEELHRLNLWIQKKMSTISQCRRILITAHDAFAYFGKAYGLQVVALQGISTESEVGTRDVVDLVTYIVTHKIPVMFIESSVPARAVQAVQQAAATYAWSVALGDELYSDSLGDNKSGADTYVHMMQHNVHAIVSGLSRDQQMQAY